MPVHVVCAQTGALAHGAATQGKQEPRAITVSAALRNSTSIILACLRAQQSPKPQNHVAAVGSARRRAARLMFQRPGSPIGDAVRRRYDRRTWQEPPAARTLLAHHWSAPLRPFLAVEPPLIMPCRLPPRPSLPDLFEHKGESCMPPQAWSRGLLRCRNIGLRFALLPHQCHHGLDKTQCRRPG